MATTTSPESPAAATDRALGLRRTEIVLIAIAPVVLGLGRFILVPFDDQQWDSMLGDMAANHTRNAVGWSLALIAAALLTAAGLALVRLVPGRPRLTAPALVGVALGWTGTAAIAVGGLVMGDMADSPQRAAMVGVLTRFNEGGGNTVFFMVLAGAVGNVLLAIGLARSGVASRGTAMLLGVGAVASLVGAPGPFKPMAVSGAILLIGAHLLLLRSLSQPEETKAPV